MIHKYHFGKRIAEHRKRLHLSQAELAEKLGVTSQAVSKWECAVTLPDLDLLLELSHLYGVSINDLLEDRDTIATLASCEYTSNEIAYFVPGKEKAENKDWVTEIVNGRWISQNWDSSLRTNNIMDELGKSIANRGGIIVEIGAGPGGGFMPYVLKADPNATMVVSNLSPTVVLEWKRLLSDKLKLPNINYAAFDFCNIPFYDDSIDIISDGGGIGNTEGREKGTALKEVYRVLKPGGLFVTSTGFVNKETLSNLPLSAQKTLMNKRPDVFEDLYEETVLAGFKKIDSVICGGWETDNDESTIADLARSLGVNLKFTSYIRYCVK